MSQCRSDISYSLCNDHSSTKGITHTCCRSFPHNTAIWRLLIILNVARVVVMVPVLSLVLVIVQCCPPEQSRSSSVLSRSGHCNNGSLIPD